MPNEIPVNQLVDQMPPVVRHQDLARVWSELAGHLGLDPEAGMEFVIAIPRDLTLRQEERADSAWGGAWEWNLADSLTRITVVGVLVTAALVAVGGGAGLAPVVIPTVLPLLFDLKRVRLERTADHYLRIIGARPDLANRSGSIDHLYDTLDAGVKAEVSKRELLEFLGMGVDAGHAKENQGVFEVLPNGETAFRIHIR